MTVLADFYFDKHFLILLNCAKVLFVIQKSVKMKFIFDVWFLPLSAAIGLGVIATNLFSFFRATKVKLVVYFYQQTGALQAVR